MPPLPLRIPSECMSGDIAGRFAVGVPYPHGPSYLDIDSFLFSSCPQFFICHDLWPVDAYDGPQASIDEGLQLVGGWFCYFPCL